MSLVKTFNANDLKQEFINFNRDYFSYQACEKIIELFEEDGTNSEIDIIGLCCDFNEDDWQYIKSNYYNVGCVSECETIDELIEELNNYTYAVETEEDYVLYINF